MSLSSVNAIVTSDTPSLEVERSSSMPLIVLTAASILSVMPVSTTSGAAPDNVVDTRISGMSIFGN